MRIMAGALDRRITLYAPLQSRNTTNGEVTITRQSRGLRWAAVLGIAPSEKAAPEQLIAKAGARLLMRLDTLTRAVRPNWQLSYDGGTFQVVGTEPSPAHGSVIVHVVGLQ